MTSDSSSNGQLLHNLMLFGRVLRGLGLDVNTGRMIDLVHALDHIDMGVKADFRYAARCLLVHDKADLPIFDQAFEFFWRRIVDQSLEIDMSDFQRRDVEIQHPEAPVLLPIIHDYPAEDNEAPSKDELEPVVEVTRTYSSRELLRQKDFSQLTDEELVEIRRLMAELIWQLGERQTRRFRPGNGNQIDMRRSLRQNLRYGGEPLKWSYRRPNRKPRPLVTIADISGSMERYTRILLHFLYSLTRGLNQPVEAFVFSTRLTRITRNLVNNEVEMAMTEVSQSVPDWSGGTRIGAALRRFNFKWARRVLSRGAVVLVISDGWDRGDPQLLSHEIARLQRSSFRLVWLNPLLGSPDYEPLTRGIMAALPHIDDFLPVHNLASIESLANHLTLLDERRPVRQQRAMVQ